MTLISIRERSRGTDGSFTATVGFEARGEYPAEIRDPFSEEEEGLLEWYFEEHLAFSFTDQETAKQAAASIAPYGEALFRQVFADAEAYATYRECTWGGLNMLRFEIIGSPEFHHLHWESLKDPKLPHAFVLQAPMARQNIRPQVMPAIARPRGRWDMGYRTISQSLVEELSRADLRVEIDILLCIEYSYSNLSPEAQRLLTCLAPFTSVICEDMEAYSDRLKQQPALAMLPFERWPQVIQEAKNWGLLSPDPDIPEYLRIQPALSYFLHGRLSLSEQAEVRQAIETAFREYYDGLGGDIYKFLTSKEPQDRLRGKKLAELEYENLMTALNLALAAQASIRNPYFAASEYLDTTRDHQQGLKLAQDVASRLQTYPTEKLSGPLGVEYIRVIDNIGLRQLQLEYFEAAQASYLKALSLQRNSTYLDTKTKRQRSGSFYHQLGILAQEQRDWIQAETYFQHVLQICIDFDDRYSQAGTYYQLGRVAQEQYHWTQAEAHFQHALQICIDFNDRYHQARIYHQLGEVAQAQGQDHWTQAETYFQQALQIKIDFADRYHQAGTYGQMSILAREQQQWPQARVYLLQALEIFVAYQDTHESNVTLYNLARLWQASGDTTLPAAIAPIMKITADEAVVLLREQLEERARRRNEQGDI